MMATSALASTARPPWRHSLRTRIALWFGLLAAAVAAAGGLAIHAVAERRALEEAEASAQRELRRASAELQALLRAIEVSAGTLARSEAAAGGDATRLRALLDATVLSEPNTVGGLVALAPAASPTPGAAWARYVGKQGRGLAETDLAARGLDVEAQPWFRDTLAADQARWSAPYFNDTAGGRWMITLNQPLPPGPAGERRGMVSLDVPIDRFNQALAPFRNDKRFRAVLHKGPLWIGDSNWLSIGTPPPSAAALDDHRRALQGAGVDAGLALRPLGPGLRGVHEALGDGWGLMALMDEDAVLAPLRETAWRFVGATLVVIALLALLSNALARSVTRPMVQLGQAAQRLAQDGFEMPTPLLVRKDEVGQLARVLDSADSALRQQMAHSQRMAQEQQKLDSELRLAHDLQQSMLPPATAVDVHEGHLDIHAVLKPAKSVGGDFYAFHPRDDGMLWFGIGDISDKGVPAALFMARTVAVLEATARSTDSPALMLARAAPRLAEGNDSCMFATALCGLVDPHTGLFELASSGHELPFIVRADGRIELFEMETGAPLGIDPDAYGEGFAGMLAPGDVLFCFTDGVTEARSRSGELFGETRLRDALKPGRSAEQVVADVVSAVEAFAAGAEPADDITVLAVGLVAPEKPADDPLHFSIWPSGLRAMNRAIDECLGSHGIDTEGQSDVRLVLEELVANAIDHGGAVECTVDLSFTERTMTLRIIDDGSAFNPLDAPDLELDPDDLDRPIGGLGLHLIKTMSLDAVYAREDDRNRLTLVLPRNPPK
jgi:sigma-B regulation protein RsbU (phosphoserine phosphatase)